jgi:hypothetical protein
VRLDAHPRLTDEAIRAALLFAAEALRADDVNRVRERVGSLAGRGAGHAQQP